ncbi:MAG: J domain-containing protein [Lachnospiraceae bacterium]|nr:J domain-containing protein [Lachnospiraceae bacterium]
MDIAKNITAEDLAGIRFWLMQESKKLEIDRANFDREKEDFEAEKKRFTAEKEMFQKAAEENRAKPKDYSDNIAYQRMLVEKKLAILENGFKELCRDKAAFEKEKEEFKKNRNSGSFGQSQVIDPGLLFSGVDNFLALKKRYRDLLKIYHPDNLSGDNGAIQIINQEFARLKDAY